MSDHPLFIVCLACFHRQRSLVNPCQKCGSRRLTHVAFLKQKYGPDWELILKVPDTLH